MAKNAEVEKDNSKQIVQDLCDLFKTRPDKLVGDLLIMREALRKFMMNGSQSKLVQWWTEHR
jgi:hypothetical protein